ncbi:MAG: peptide/nickel transport system permease protein [Pyrinomonadaceae bacterium]|nr:peptide/nickel transport system permease protein [Pyrinomonadaceae bacterium]
MTDTQPPLPPDTRAAPHPSHADAWERAHAAPVSWRARARRRLARRGKLIAGLGIVSTFYVIAVLANFIAPYDASEQSRQQPFAPPTRIRFQDAEGRWHARPFIYRLRLTDPLARTYGEDTSARFPLALFTRSHAYKLFGLFSTNRHLFGVAADATPNASATPQRVYLLGTDDFGRDRLSRLLMASRFSLAVGPLGTLLAGVLGVVLGCVSGYAGRRVDALLMRAADAMLALPDLVLILAARAAFPLVLPPSSAGLLLVGIFIAIGWAEMARLARGLVLGLREREFVLAAVSLGLTQRRILFRHILPNASRPLVVQLSLMLPAFLLAETALSFLGVGVQEPAASWGNMLVAASNLTLLGQQPLVLLSPAFAIFLFVLGVRLLSDGLRRDGDSRAR